MFLLTTSVNIDVIIKHDSSVSSKASISAMSVLLTTIFIFFDLKDIRTNYLFAHKNIITASCENPRLRFATFELRYTFVWIFQIIYCCIFYWGTYIACLITYIRSCFEGRPFIYPANPLNRWTSIPVSFAWCISLGNFSVMHSFNSLMYCIWLFPMTWQFLINEKT